jgi:flagellar basal-body rod modification protein FlgD
METFSIHSPGSTKVNGVAQGAPANPAQSLGSEQFMMLLLAQLRNQNPLEPMDDKDLMGQVTQLNSLQELQKMSSAIQSMKKSNQLTESVGIIGKTVEYASPEGELLSGLVTGVSLINDQVVLWVGDQMIPLAAVVSVSSDDMEQGEA